MPVLDAQGSLAFLADAGAVLAGSLDLERTLSEVAALAVPEIADWCAVDLLQEDGTTRQISSGHPDPEQEAFLMELRRRYRSEESADRGVARVIRTGEPILEEDTTGPVRIEIKPEEQDLYARLAPKSYMIVPLQARGRALGAMTILSTRAGRHYQRQDLDFAQHLASRFSLAIDNARLYDEADHSLALLDTLFASAPMGLSFYDSDFKCVRANQALADINGIPVEEHLGRSASELIGEAGQDLERLLRGVLETGKPVLGLEVTGKTLARPGEVRHFEVSYYPVGAGVGVGVLVQDVTDRKRMTERTALLAELSGALDASLDLDATLANVAHASVPQFADWCAVHMVTGVGLIEQVAVAHSEPAQEELARQMDERYPQDPGAPAGPGAAIRTGEIQFISDVPPQLLGVLAVDDEHVRLIDGLGIHSSITVPLRARGRTFGAMSFALAEREGVFSDDDVGLAEELARRSALAVENARLYTERSRIAHTLQTGLLPQRVPHIPGLELAVRYRAAGELDEVGGDFYDAFARADEEWALIIGDVSGKGARAAVLTALARYTLRTAAMVPHSPSDALRTLNDAFIQQIDTGEFCTVCFASVRAASDGRPGAEVTLALGGHPEAIVLRADGRLERLGRHGTLIGVVDQPDVTDVTGRLGPGDSMLLYTDGVPDAGGWGEDRLEEVVRATAGQDAATVVQRVEEEAVAAADGDPRDDIALVALRVPD